MVLPRSWSWARRPVAGCKYLPQELGAEVRAGNPSLGTGRLRGRGWRAAPLRPSTGKPIFLWKGQWGRVGFVPFQLRREPLGLHGLGGAGAGVGEEARRQGQRWQRAAGCPAEFEIVPGAACNRGLAVPRGAPPALHLTNVGRRARGSRGLAPTPCVRPPGRPRGCRAVPCRAVPCCEQEGSALAHCQAGKQAELGEGRVHP